MHFFDINNALFEVAGYPLSFLELLATTVLLASVWLATRSHIGTWPTGIVSNIAFFALFYQINLYSDMLLQVFFVAISIFGWINWGKRNEGEDLPIKGLSFRWQGIWLLILIATFLLWGLLMAHIHEIMPQFFPEAAAYPFADAFTTMASVLATFLMAKKLWEAWVLWIVVDIISIFLYFLKGIQFVAVEYVIFLGLATWGLMNWRRMMKNAGNP